MVPYEPRKILLGHNTLAIADPRSVESLVSLKQSNVAWMKKFSDRNSQNSAERLQRLRREAEEHLRLDGTRTAPREETTTEPYFPIDPALGDFVMRRPDIPKKRPG
ncbi:JmjC domain protein [Penicillium argentinense]|uniref:JmjC domain protein n=1 Tax=Penicillium argentinense TaxID=1131581 RepID=A0A9W9FFJ5_9EURO|nr:JmjC domain protein [Penicillium argentinense]KAJ5099234.1 JmjC domain protein [Penicillium argentinense]